MTIARFPTKVRLTVARGQDCDRLVEASVEATDQALTRALRRAANLHLVHDARSDPALRPRIEVRFTGADLPAGTTARLREQLADLAAARAAELRARPSRDTSPASRRTATEAPEEQYDDTRVVADPREPVDDTYLVPSYDGGGNRVAVPLQGPSRTDREARARAASQPTHLELAEIHDRDTLVAHIARRYGANPPRVFVAVYAALYRNQRTPFGVLVHTDESGFITSVKDLGLLWLYDPPTGEGTGHWRSGAIFGVDALEFDRVARTSDERRFIRVDWQMQFLRMAAHGAQLTDVQLRRIAEDLTEHMPDPGGTTFYYWYLANGTRRSMAELGKPLPVQGRVPVAVFTKRVSGVSERSRGGGEPGGGHDDPPLPLGELLGFEPDATRPFLAEPPFSDWPPSVAARLGDLIAEIADRARMQPGRFPGMFILTAMAKISRDARRLGWLAGSGQEGDSPRMTVIHRLVSAIAPLEELRHFYTRVIAAADESDTLPRPLRHNSPSWLLHFYEEYGPRRDDAIASLFAATCQDILLDILETSHRHIEQRQNHFPAYMKLTRALILLLLVDQSELTQLREILTSATAPTWASVAAPAGTEISAWYGSTRLLTAALGHVDVDSGGQPQRGRIRYTADGPQVQDSVGRWWSRAELDSVLAGGRQQAFAVDPLLEKLSDIPDVVERLRTAGASGIDEEFRSLLQDLRDENESKTLDVRADVDIAFGLASFRETKIRHREDIGAQLSGIHAQANRVLIPLFAGAAADAYVRGMRHLVSSELGMEEFLDFFNIVGLTAIAIVCPPAAFAIGAAEAVVAVDTALEHRGIQRAMLGGDEILTKAQAEAELWGAAIGAALVFLPEVPGIVRGATRGISAVARGEAREAAAAAGRGLAQRATIHLAELAARDLTQAFVAQCLEGYLLGLAINGAVARYTEAIAREVQVTGQVPAADLPRLIQDAITGPAQPAPPTEAK